MFPHAARRLFPAALLLLLSVHALAAGPAEVLRKHGVTGTLDWTRMLAGAKGSATAPKEAENTPKAHAMALRAAQKQAALNLKATLMSIRVDETATVAELAAKKPEISERLDLILRSATVTERESLDNGAVRVALRLPLYGAFALLVLPPGGTEKSARTPAAPAPGGAAPPPAPEKPAKTAKETAPAPPPSRPVTGLVVDARGLGAEPAMSPRIVDEAGAEIFGPSVFSRAAAVQNGAVLCFPAPEAALASPRAGNNPLTVKAAAVKGKGKTEIVLGRSEAKAIQNAPGAKDALRECRVLLVTE
jgi:hypothetical protein